MLPCVAPVYLLLACYLEVKVSSFESGLLLFFCLHHIVTVTLWLESNLIRMLQRCSFWFWRWQIIWFYNIIEKQIFFSVQKKPKLRQKVNFIVIIVIS